MKGKNEKRNLDKVLVTAIIILACILVFIVSAIISRNLVDTWYNNSNSISASEKIAEQKKTEIEERKEIEDVVKNIQSEEISTEEKNEIIKQQTEKIKKDKVTEEYKKYENLPEEEKSKVVVTPKKYDVDESEFDKIKEYQDEHIPEQKENSIENKKEDKKENTDNKSDTKDDDLRSLPSRFSLKEIIDLKLENQGEKGLCWAYSAFNSIETNLYLSTGKLYDFSEYYVDYLSSNSANAGFGRRIGEGGDYSVIEQLLYEQQTIPEEKELENCEYMEQQYHGFGEIKGEKIIITKAAAFPSFSKQKTNSQDYELYHNILKTHIMNYGSVWCGMIASSNTYIYRESDEDIPFNPEGHAVSIIGWDDNIPKEKFMNENNKMPENDGGYIIFNSWGEYYGEDGYGYISYEDYEAFSYLYGVMSINKMEDMLKLSDIKSKEIRNCLEKNTQCIIEIDGIKYIKPYEVYYLDLSNSDISDISELKYFTKLNILNISNTKVSNIDVLKNCKELWALELQNTKVKDVSCLQNLQDLFLLNLSDNPGIEGYELLTSIGRLELSNCGIKNFKYSNDNLYYLDLSKNPIESLIIPEECKMDYFELNLGNCNLKDISFLNKYKKIDVLELKDNPGVTGDLSNVKVDSLRLSNCGITNEFNFFNLKGLSHICLTKNDIDVEKMMETFNKIKSQNDLFIEISDENAESYSTDGIIFYNEIIIPENYDETEHVEIEKDVIEKNIEVRELNNNTYIYPRELINNDKLNYMKENNKIIGNYVYVYDYKLNEKEVHTHLNTKQLASTIKTVKYETMKEDYSLVDVEFKIVINKDLKPRKLYATPMKNKFASEDDVDLRNTFVQLGYGNGVYEIIKDFEIIEPEKYEKGANKVTFRKDGLECSVYIFIGDIGEMPETFTIQFREDSKLIYDIANSMLFNLRAIDLANNTIELQYNTLFRPWYIQIGIESLPELEDLPKEIPISGILLVYDDDNNKEVPDSMKIGKNELDILEGLPYLNEFVIVTMDEEKTEEDYLDIDVLNAIKREYDYSFEVYIPSFIMVYFDYESDLYQRCIEAIPEEYIFYGEDEQSGKFYIEILWHDLRLNYGDEPDIKLEIYNLAELSELSMEFPAKEITLQLDGINFDDAYEMEIRELAQMRTLRKLILADTDSNKELSNYLSDEFVQEMSEYFEIEYINE